jgi:vesicle-fusing ATPase
MALRRPQLRKRRELECRTAIRSISMCSMIFLSLVLVFLRASNAFAFQTYPHYSSPTTTKARTRSVRRTYPTRPLSATVESPEQVTETPTDSDSESDSISSSDFPVREDSIFDLIAGRTSVCLFESDIRRDAIGKHAGAQASSATNWIHDASAFQLQQAFDKIKLKLADERTGTDRDEAASWLRWMKSTPTPAIIDFSKDFRSIVNTTLTDRALDMIDQKRAGFLQRVGCRLILLPSGAQLPSPLVEPTASIIYGKLLYGGVTRFRLLGSHNANNQKPPRRAAIRTEVKLTPKENVPAWLMYGGPDRMYEAVDMGPAAILEVMLLPRGKELVSVTGDNNMVVNGMVWKPQKMFDFDMKGETTNGGDAVLDSIGVSGYSPSSLSGKDRNEAFRSDFRSTVGGLQPQIESIVRRVLDGRVIKPAEEASQGDGDSASSGGDETTTELSTAALEAEELSLLGLSPVRGLLLYGPPGCGKTALAREISRSLRARAPKIVSAPELLDRWVGGSEKLTRLLFADAEAELAACNGDATKSALHVIVIDEIDAVFRKRSSAEDSGESTRSSVVNQILAKLDGVNAIPNVLMIGMTNRRELLDGALLRPGRLEVQIEIPLPDKVGRREIIQIHFEALRRKGRLSKPLCCAMDGVSTNYDYQGDFIEFSPNGDVTKDSGVVSAGGTQVKGRKRKAIRRAINQVVDGFPAAVRPVYDLAADYASGGFSGADIAGLVRCAGSIALARSRNDGNGVEGLLITLEDVKQALTEVKR